MQEQLERRCRQSEGERLKKGVTSSAILKNRRRSMIGALDGMSHRISCDRSGDNKNYDQRKYQNSAAKVRISFNFRFRDDKLERSLTAKP